MSLDPGAISIGITIVVGIFTAGVTWGIMSAKQRSITTRVDNALADLKTVVSDLRALAADVKVNAAISSRVESHLAVHDEKISQLESEVAKLQARIS